MICVLSVAGQHVSSVSPDNVHPQLPGLYLMPTRPFTLTRESDQPANLISQGVSLLRTPDLLLRLSQPPAIE